MSREAVAAAVAAARTGGLAVSEPRVIRDLSNVLVELAPAPVVARVATTTGAARADGARDWLARDVAVASFLAARGALVVAPADELPPGPVLRDGYAITFWRYVAHDPERRPGAVETAAALRALHSELASFPGALPPLSATLDEASDLIDRCRLEERLGGPLARVREELDGLGLPERPLHGDAHAGNLLRCPDGLVWTDFEDTCRGPVEWDLACLVAAGGDERAALDAYGAPEARLGPFVEARLLQLAAWTAFMAERHPQLRERAAERLGRFLQDPGTE